MTETKTAATKPPLATRRYRQTPDWGLMVSPQRCGHLPSPC